MLGRWDFRVTYASQIISTRLHSQSLSSFLPSFNCIEVIDIDYIFSVPYIVVEIPMNLLLKRIGPNPMLPLMVTLWGVICACQGMSFDRETGYVSKTAEQEQ